jgi:DUF4097 and DUF4098 domain-containing protein YvlB
MMPKESTMPMDAVQEQEFSCEGPISAQVRIGGGTVRVSADDSRVIVVRVSPEDSSESSLSAVENTTIQFSGNRLRVETPESGGRLFRRGGKVVVDISLPPDSQLQANVGSADVHVEGRLADVTVQSGSGDTFVDEASGDVTVKSGSGDVRAERVGGALRVHSGSGDVTATSVSGQAVVEVASGDVAIEDASGAVKATSASGDITIGAAHGDQVRINSASGDVTVGVPAGTLVWLDLSTVSGSTNSDLSLTAQAMSQATEQSRVPLSLQLRTVSGDINVFRTNGAEA